MQDKRGIFLHDVKVKDDVKMAWYINTWVEYATFHVLFDVHALKLNLSIREGAVRLACPPEKFSRWKILSSNFLRSIWKDFAEFLKLKTSFLQKIYNLANS